MDKSGKLKVEENSEKLNWGRRRTGERALAKKNEAGCKIGQG